MKRFVKCLLLSAILIGGLLVVALYALPPFIEDFCQNKLAEFGIHSDIRIKTGLLWTNTGPGLFASARISVPDTDWNARADFSASAFQWHATAKLAETQFSESDVLIRKLLHDYPITAVSNLTFSGKVSFSASADRTFTMPVPVWSATANVKSFSADAFNGENPISLRDFSVSGAVSGIADHYEIAPIHPRAEHVSFSTLSMTNFTATIYATTNRLLVTRASAGLYGGTVNVYSLFLNTTTLTTGFSLYLEDIDAGKALMSFNGFEGTASGRLHGKIKMSLRNGGSDIRIRDAFLYSVPGTKSKLKLSDSSAITDNLALAGIDKENRDNVSTALSDLDCSVLRIDLKRVDKNAATLGICIEGTATRFGISAPVTLNVTLRGDIEQLINTSLKLKESQQKK